MEILIAYLNTVSTSGLLNAAICFGICTRLMFYRRNGAKYSPFYSCIAYALTVSSGAICISILAHKYTLVDVWEVILNGTLFLAVLAAKGNIALIMRGNNSRRITDGRTNY